MRRAIRITTGRGMGAIESPLLRLSLHVYSAKHYVPYSLRDAVDRQILGLKRVGYWRAAWQWGDWYVGIGK